MAESFSLEFDKPGLLSIIMAFSIPIHIELVSAIELKKEKPTGE